MYSKDFLQEAQSTINTVLERPPVDPINPKTDTLTFMCTDIDTYADKPPKYLAGSARMANMNQDACIVRLYGANDKGNSIAVHVYNFRPYFYIQVPVTMGI